MRAGDTIQHMDHIPKHIAGLLAPDAYPHPVTRVELIQTHISYVLLAGDFVYKIKKPLDLGFLNFTTLRRRHYYCRQEVMLNRRLCSDTYLGVMPITRAGGRYHVGGRGRAVEYAVQMRRLPAHLMMDHLLEDGELDLGMVDRLADKIARFHSASDTGPGIDRYGSPRLIESNWTENFDQTRAFVGVTITRRQLRFVEEYVSAFLVRQRRLLRERVRGGHIRDCHGDLRASAVCFSEEICVYDCIEFNRRFRYSDIASEVAFLTMDLDQRGRSDLADRFASRYRHVSGDEGLESVLNFYKCYRAYVRGKVNAFQLDEPEIPEESKTAARESARRYFDLACRYASADRPPLLLIMVGLSGTGKSAVANALASALNLHVVSSDVVRKELADLTMADRRHEDYEHGIYSPAFTRKTYAALRRRARDLLARGESVVLDATFLLREQREQALELAQTTGALFFCIETQAEAEVVWQRLAAREHDLAALSDARWETYLAQRSRFEDLSGLDEWNYVSLNAGQPLDDVVADALDALAGRLHPAPTTDSAIESTL